MKVKVKDIKRQSMKLNSKFYKLNAMEMAPKLLGKFLCRRLENGEVIKARITETECYYGTSDTACHASKGKTERNAPMFEEGGILYVYLCYGMHYMLNIVSGEKGSPEAVLIRGVEGHIGPGRATKYLKINKLHNRENLITSDTVWLEDDGKVFKFKTAKRVGISYAKQEDQDRLWRFII